MREACEMIWSRAGIREAVELDLGHRLVAGDGHADGEAHDARFGQRRVDDALLAEALDQALGHAEDAAVLADVLAQDDHPGVALHLLLERLVDGLHHVQPSHGTALLHAGPYAARARPAARPTAASSRRTRERRSRPGRGVRRPRRRPPRRPPACSACCQRGCFRGVVQQAVALHVAGEAQDGVALAPHLDLLLGPVAGGVVRGGVVGHPVGERLDQRRTVAARGPARAPRSRRGRRRRRRCRRPGCPACRTPIAFCATVQACV